MHTKIGSVASFPSRRCKIVKMNIFVHIYDYGTCVQFEKKKENLLTQELAFVFHYRRNKPKTGTIQPVTFYKAVDTAQRHINTNFLKNK